MAATANQGLLQKQNKSKDSIPSNNNKESAGQSPVPVQATYDLLCPKSEIPSYPAPQSAPPAPSQIRPAGPTPAAPCTTVTSYLSLTKPMVSTISSASALASTSCGAPGTSRPTSPAVQAPAVCLTEESVTPGTPTQPKTVSKLPISNNSGGAALTSRKATTPLLSSEAPPVRLRTPSSPRTSSDSAKVNISF